MELPNKNQLCRVLCGNGRTADDIFDLFAELVNSGKTILMVTHDNDLARRAQETVELADGEVVDRRIN